MENNRPNLFLGPIQNLHDARYAAAMGVDYLIFNTQGDYGYNTEELLQIKGWISGPGIILHFGNESTEEILAMISVLAPSMIILSDQDIEMEGIPVIRMIYSNEKNPVAPTLIAEMELNGQKKKIHTLDTPVPFPELNLENPYGYWLGAFSLTSEGLLDYEACDAFLSGIAQDV